ncbi:GLPGLI family protein [Chryseobacterium defluvii]|uniref:GLPGLI family protein n=1 Tax=Chryseobacterium defluvii TaxID=160396 RepID=A0A840KH20_9FLAO|nr:GLPGLI family protein [Chryseobacterium defluvii]MBB4807308.1 GLPGLI family protein [Chryseobacterium defluvii]
MKKLFAFLLLFIVSTKYTAQNIKTDFFVTYDVEYPIYKKKNTEQFLLFINTKENTSYYTSTNQYVLDSLKTNGKIKSNDFMAGMNYSTALGEEVVKKNSTYNVYEKVVDAKIKYIEPVALKWTILKDIKVYSGYKTRKAVTTAYGRKWIAWYTEDLPLNFGPYKFSGLPGIIVNIYDEKAEYLFTLSQFKKKVKIVPLPKDKSYKEFPKKKTKEIKYNALSDLSGMIFDDPNEKRRMEQSNQRRIKESPQLDIE